MPDDRHDDGSFVISRRQVLGGGLAGAAGLVLGSGLPGVTGPSALGAGVASGTPGAPEALRVDNLLAPIGLGLDDVFFSWRVGDHRRGARQRAYRIVVTRVVPAPPGRPAR